MKIYEQMLVCIISKLLFRLLSTFSDIADLEPEKPQKTSQPFCFSSKLDEVANT